MKKPTQKHTPTGNIRIVPAWLGLSLRVEVQIKVTYTNPWNPFKESRQPEYYWRKAKVSDFCNPSFKMTGKPYSMPSGKYR